MLKATMPWLVAWCSGTLGGQQWSCACCPGCCTAAEALGNAAYQQHATAKVMSASTHPCLLRVQHPMLLFYCLQEKPSLSHTTLSTQQTRLRCTLVLSTQGSG